MDLNKLIKKKLASTIKKLPDDKIIEFVKEEEKREREKDWKDRFDAFLSKVEENADGIDEETKKKINESREIHNKK